MINEIVKFGSNVATKQVGNSVFNSLIMEAVKSLPGKLHSVAINVALKDNMGNAATFLVKQFANGSIHILTGK